MEVEAETTVARPVQEVFDYLAHAEYLPEYMSDFETVTLASGGPPGPGAEYRYKMKRGGEGTFKWTRFEPTTALAWEGPPVKVGPGSMEPAGRWELSPAGDRTRIRFVMAPRPGGLFKWLAPFMAAAMRRENVVALERLKERLESAPAL